MQVLAAFATAPGYRKQALERYRRSIPNFYARLYATPGSALSTEIGGILSDNDPRFTMRSREVFETAGFETLRNTITERLKNGAIEIGIVGDVDEEAADVQSAHIHYHSVAKQLGGQRLEKCRWHARPSLKRG